MDPDSAVAGGAAFDIVVVAASAGGPQALIRLVSGLPANLAAPVAIVQHMAPDRQSRLAEILDRRTGLSVREAREGDEPRAGVVYVAPSSRHLLLQQEDALRFRLSRADRVNFVRPAADLLFSSAAAALGPRTLAVILTGTGHDGAGGARAVRTAGGTVIAQDEDSSDHFSMPRAAIEMGVVDRVLSLEDIAPKIVELMGTS